MGGAGKLGGNRMGWNGFASFSFVVFWLVFVSGFMAYGFLDDLMRGVRLLRYRLYVAYPSTYLGMASI